MPAEGPKICGGLLKENILHCMEETLLYGSQHKAEFNFPRPFVIIKMGTSLKNTGSDDS